MAIPKRAYARKLTDAQIDLIQRGVQDGRSINGMANQVGCARTTIRYYKKLIEKSYQVITTPLPAGERLSKPPRFKPLPIKITNLTGDEY